MALPGLSEKGRHTLARRYGSGMRLTGESQRLARFEWKGDVLHGRLMTEDGDDVLEVLSADPVRGTAEPTGRRVPLHNVRLLAPVSPGKIVAVGRRPRSAPRATGRGRGSAPPGRSRRTAA